MKALKDFIRTKRKMILLSLLFFIVFLFVLFPYEDVIQKVVLKLSKSPTNPIHFRYESSSIGFFPPHVSFKNAEFQIPQIPKPIASDRLILKPSYLSLLALHLGIQIEIVKGSSRVKIRIKQSSYKKQKRLHIRVKSKKLDVQHLSFLSGFFSRAKGVLEFFLDLQLDPSYVTPPKGTLQLKGTNMSFYPFSFSKKYIGTINLPQLDWKTLEGKVLINKDQIDIQNIEIGKTADPFYLFLKGYVNVSFSQFRKYIKDYEIELNWILDKKIKDLLFFIDLFLSDIEEKLPENRFQYKAKVTGRSSYPPKIQKIK